MARTGRPKEDDPHEQKAIYPRRSLWARLVAYATGRGERPATLATEFIKEGLDRREANDA